MEKSLLKLECLKLVKTHLGPAEVIAQAEQYVKYCLGDETVPSVLDPIKDVQTSTNSDNSPPPLPGVVKPDAGGKDHKKYSKN